MPPARPIRNTLTQSAASRVISRQPKRNTPSSSANSPSEPTHIASTTNPASANPSVTLSPASPITRPPSSSDNSGRSKQTCTSLPRGGSSGHTRISSEHLGAGVNLQRRIGYPKTRPRRSGLSIPMRRRIAYIPIIRSTAIRTYPPFLDTPTISRISISRWCNRRTQRWRYQIRPQPTPHQPLLHMAHHLRQLRLPRQAHTSPQHPHPQQVTHWLRLLPRRVEPTNAHQYWLC